MQLCNDAKRRKFYLEIATHGLRKSRIEGCVEKDGVVKTKCKHT